MPEVARVPDGEPVDSPGLVPPVLPSVREPEASELCWDAVTEVLKADSELPVTEPDISPEETPVEDTIEPLEVPLKEPELPSVKESEVEDGEEEISELCWDGESEVLEAPESELPGEDVD